MFQSAGSEVGMFEIFLAIALQGELEQAQYDAVRETSTCLAVLAESLHTQGSTHWHKLRVFSIRQRTT